LGVDLGGIAVCFFFVISGFLIVKSYENSSTAYNYLVKRILRIMPGFFAAFLISVLVLGAMGTIRDPHKLQRLILYFQSFPVAKMIFQFFTLEAPRGPKTFSWNPLPNKINEPLWTIQYEFFCYLLVPVLGLLSVVKGKWMAVAFFLVSYTLLVLQIVELIPYNLGYTGDAVFLNPAEMPRLLSFFFAGTCFYFFRDVIKYNRLLVLLALFLIGLVSWLGFGFNIVMPFAGTYLIFSLAYHPNIKFHGFAKKGDYSYGLYLYGWPMQQLLMYFIGKYLGPNRLFVMAFPMALTAAYLSWNIIEHPFLKLKSRKRNALLEPINDPVS
jgi:peptidoglycan/LPS O-acetylase OafA/YrhL